MRAKTAIGFCMASAVAVALCGGRPAFAEDAAPARSLYLELNAAESSQKGCRLTFLVTNDLGADIAGAGFELALFNAEGVVERLTVLEFRDMPAGKTNVSRFDLAAADCGKIGRILVNAATRCEGAGVAAGDCMKGIRTASKTAIAFGV